MSDNHREDHQSAPESEVAAATPVDEKQYWLDDMANVHKIYWGLWIVCILLVGADFLYQKHAEFPIEGYFGFFGFYGFISCVSLVLTAKVLRRIVSRPEDYYD